MSDERCSVCNGLLGVRCNLEGPRPDCPRTQFLVERLGPPADTPDDARTVREALTFMRDCGDRPGMYDSGGAALAALDRLVAHTATQRDALAFYAEKRHLHREWSGEWVIRDRGERARASLAAVGGEQAGPTETT